MNITLARHATFVIVALLSPACNRTPTAPTPAATRPPAIAPVPPGASPVPEFPGIARAARIYLNSDLYAYLAGSSRFVLYEDGAFTLQFATGRSGFFEYPGTYEQAGDDMQFYFMPAGTHGASGRLRDDTLSISYSALMQHSDFENGVYRLVR